MADEHLQAAADLLEPDDPILARDREVVDAEMDITPMIDCVFLLLIFFIVCSTMERQSPIEMAKARHGKGVSERSAVIITVGEGGVDEAPIFLTDGVDENPVAGDADQQRELIRVYVEKGKRDDAKQDVLIKADRNVAHRDVSRVIKAASSVEGMNIHLGVFEAD
jgi:biopolymer transport protein ExbD